MTGLEIERGVGVRFDHEYHTRPTEMVVNHPQFHTPHAQWEKKKVEHETFLYLGTLITNLVPRYFFLYEKCHYIDIYTDILYHYIDIYIDIL